MSPCNYCGAPGGTVGAVTICEPCADASAWFLCCPGCGSTFPMPPYFNPDLDCPHCGRRVCNP